MNPFSRLINNTTFRRLFIIAISSFFLLLPGLYNGFPYVTPDTGIYILSGWSIHVPIDRPITYGVFIRITSLFGLSLWGVVWAQTFILVYYLKRVSEKVLSDLYSDRIFFCVILLLTAFTSIPWFCSQLIPDIFTSVMVLAISDFYLSPRAKLKSRVLSFLLIAIFIEMHNSHLLIVLICCVLLRIYSLVHKKKWLIKKTVFLFGVTLFSFISISFFNLWEGNSFRPSAGTHVFLMGRMAENGILDRFLAEYCPTEHYSLCKYQGQTGDRCWNFMWNDKGHLYDAGGWDKTEKEYNTIIRRSLVRPKYLAMHIYESLEGTLRQLSQFSVEFIPQGENSSPYNNINTFYPHEIKEYKTCLQQLGQLDPIMNIFNVLFLIFGLGCIFVTCMLFQKHNNEAYQLNWNFALSLFLLFILVNAFITSTFSTVYCRLESRVMWLLPFGCILYMMRFYLNKHISEAKQ